MKKLILLIFVLLFSVQWIPKSINWELQNGKFFRALEGSNIIESTDFMMMFGVCYRNEGGCLVVIECPKGVKPV